MATLFCANCGSEMDEAMNFCRRCGAPAANLEATTRTLEHGTGSEASTGFVSSPFTGPAYLSPPEVYPATAATTNNLKKSKKTRNVVFGLIGAFVFIIAMMIAGLVIFAT